MMRSLYFWGCRKCRTGKWWESAGLQKAAA